MYDFDNDFNFYDDDDSVTNESTEEFSILLKPQKEAAIADAE